MNNYIKNNQRFRDLLAQLLQIGHVPGTSPEWRWIAGNMRNMGRTFRKEIKTMAVTLESNVFEGVETDARILRVWREVRAVADLLI